MPTHILMPALSPTMTEGTLARWLKSEGDAVAAGDVLAEIETDKATMEVEAVEEGVLTKILVPGGTTNVAVNAPIAVLVENGDAAPAAAPKAVTPPAATGPEMAAQAAPLVPQAAAAPPPPPTQNGHDADSRIFASPLARRMATDAGIDLAVLKGSGPNGRIVRVDIEQAKGAPKQQAAPAPPAPPPPAPPAALAPASAAKPAPAKSPAIAAPHRLVKHSMMRKVIARRLTEAKQTVPHFYVSIDIALDKLLALRTDLNARSAKDGPDAFKVSVNDFVIKGSALALRRVPGVNASFTDDGTAFYDDVDISVAVAIKDGLITPIIRQADRKSLVVISGEMKALAARAKAGKLQPDEYQGGGFSISNLGMFGITTFSAVINPPQGAILAVGAGEQRAVVKDGQLGVATMMTCTMSVDHRVVDGALGAEWLQIFKQILEDPLGMLL